MYKSKKSGFSKRPFKPGKKITNETNIDAKYLIIVESPSKCTKIESYLGSEYCCIASNGHIRTIDGLKSIDTKKTFEPTFSFIDEKNDHVEYMRKIITRFSKDNIILATDDDREGEAIAWHICKVFDLSIETTPRIIFHEITKPAIVDAVRSPIKINMQIVHAQHARQVLDIIVGYKVSPFLWKYLYNNKSNSLSAGRCQTPALRLVYDNEQKKNDSKCIEYKYKTTGSFFSKNIDFDLNKEFDSKEQVLEFLNKTQGFVHRLTICSPKETTRSAPKPFHTSRLLQTASNVLHISPKETMSLCQQLYQNGYITYMRTESSQYSQIFLEQIKKYITDQWSSDKYLGNLDKLVNKDASNPHEAIRVTQLNMSCLPSEDGRLASLYKLIWKNTVESCMSDAIFNIIGVRISAPDDLYYSYTIEIPLFLGWKKIGERTMETDAQNNPSALHLFFQSALSSPVLYNSIDSTVVIRNKHQYYTEASLINDLEDLGIGRPSTFASIVETIQERGYVKCTNIEGTTMKCTEYKLNGLNKLPFSIIEISKDRIFGAEKNKLVIQSVGILTIEFLIQNFESMFSYDYTKLMENKLDHISTGKELEWSSVCNECYNEIKRLSKDAGIVTKQTYMIDDLHHLVFEKYGPVIKQTQDDGTIEYLPVKKDVTINLERLKKNEYTLDDLLDIKIKSLGKYEGEDLYIKNGRYGLYLEWGDNRESIKQIDIPNDDISIADVSTFLKNIKSKKENEKEVDNNVLRTLNNFMSVRKGKFGAYVYYKRPDMKSPQFLNIKKFPEGFFACEPETLVNWLCKTYKLPCI